MNTKPTSKSVKANDNIGHYLETNDNALRHLPASGVLRKYIEAIEIFEQTKKGMAEKIKDLQERKRGMADIINRHYALAETEGFEPDAIKTTVRVRATKWAQLDQKQKELRDTYVTAMGLD